MKPASVTAFIRGYVPPNLDEFDARKKLDKSKDLPRPSTKQRFFDELYVLDKLETEPVASTERKAASFTKLRKPKKKKKLTVRKKVSKNYYSTLYDDELQSLSEKQTARLARNIVDYIRFYCPTNQKHKFRLMDIEELLHFPLFIHQSFANFVHWVKEQTKDPTEKPGLFSSTPMYSSSLSSTRDSRWKMPSKGVKLDDEMSRKVPKKPPTAESEINGNRIGSPLEMHYPTSVPNTAASSLATNYRHKPSSHTMNQIQEEFASQENTNSYDNEKEGDRYKAMIELVLRLKTYFTLAGMKPIQWFDILTNYKQDIFQQNLYYNEFYYGLLKFCKEMNLIPFKEYEIELIFEYFVRLSLWTAFLEHINHKEETETEKLIEREKIDHDNTFPDSRSATLILTRQQTQQRLAASENVNNTYYNEPPSTPSHPTTEILPSIRRHDFKIGFKKLSLSSKRIFWLNHQAEILTKCSQYLEMLKISLYHYSMRIMINLHQKHEEIDHALAAAELSQFIEDDSMSVISTSSLQNLQNLQMLENTLITTRELESMLCKLLNDVMIFINTKDVDQVIRKYQIAKGMIIPSPREKRSTTHGDDNDSVVSDLSITSLDIKPGLIMKGGSSTSGSPKAIRSLPSLSPSKLKLQSTSRSNSAASPLDKHLATIRNNPFQNASNALLNEELSTKSLFDDVVSESSSIKEGKSSSRAPSVTEAMIYPDNGLRSGAISRSRSRTTTVDEGNEDADENEEEEEDHHIFDLKPPSQRPQVQRGLSMKFVAPLLQSRALSMKSLLPLNTLANTNIPNDSTGKSPQPTIPRTFSNDMTNSKSPTKSSFKSISTITEDMGAPSPNPTGGLQKQKSVRLNLTDDQLIPEGMDVLRRKNSMMGSTNSSRKASRKNDDDNDETMLTYMTEEFRSTIFEYDFDLIRSRPPSTQNEFRPTLMRQNSRIQNSIKSRSNSMEFTDGSAYNSRRSSSNMRSFSINEGGGGQSSKKGSFAMYDLHSTSHDSQGSMGSMSMKKRNQSISLNPDNTYSFNNFEDITNRHFILQRYSSSNIEHLPHQPSNSTNNNSYNDIKSAANASTASTANSFSALKDPSVTVKDPLLENPNRFYEEYKQFGQKMQEEKQRHLNNYRVITQNFDRRISLAKIRLNQLYGNDGPSTSEKEPKSRSSLSLSSSKK